MAGEPPTSAGVAPERRSKAPLGPEGQASPGASALGPGVVSAAAYADVLTHASMWMLIAAMMAKKKCLYPFLQVSACSP